MSGVVSEYFQEYRYILRLTHLITGSIPGINNLLSMIKTRRRRDSIIIGCIIGLCIVLLLSYVF